MTTDTYQVVTVRQISHAPDMTDYLTLVDVSPLTARRQ